MYSRRTTVEILALLFILIACAKLGFYELFSNYRGYDDEGLFMLSNKLYLNGYAPYNEITWIFGPLQLAAVKFLHGWCEIPISNSSVRFLTLVLWLLLALTSYWLVRRLTRAWLWSASAFILVFLYPRTLVNEPGHPQVLVAMLTFLVPLVGSWHESRGGRLPWFFAGAFVAAVFHIKINAGVFCIAAVLVVLLSQHKSKAQFRYIYPAIVTISMLLPLLLMYPLLSVEHCLSFALIVSFSTASFAVVAPFQSSASEHITQHAVALFGGFALVTALAVGFGTLEGVGPLDIFSSLMQLSASQIEFFHFFREYSLAQVCMAGLSLVLALFAVRLKNPMIVNRILWSARSIFLVTVFYAIVIDDAANSQALLGYAAPWCWLAAMKTSGEATSRGRMLLVAIAVWMPLLAYPIPGTQLYFGGLLILTAAIVCAADASALLIPKLQGRVIPFGTNVLPLTVLLMAAALLVALHSTAKKQYARYQPLQLAGTEFMRIEPHRAELYRDLVRALNGADVVLTSFRFNSLYFWTDAQIPSPGFLSQYPLMYASPEQQKLGKTGVLNASRPILVIKKTDLFESGPDMFNWIDEHFETSDEIGPYRLMTRRSRPL